MDLFIPLTILVVIAVVAFLVVAIFSGIRSVPYDERGAWFFFLD